VTSCLLRYEPATRLVEAICEAAKGERFFSQPLLSKLVTPLISPPTQDTPSLTKQELKVLRLVTEEKTNKEIAQLLQISERTVCNYLQSIRTKLDTQTTIAAVFRATQLGILPF
jgi:DNA-binding NarL/FixJ family response regulator